MAEMFGCLIFGRAKLVYLVIGLTQMSGLSRILAADTGHKVLIDVYNYLTFSS